MGDKNTVYLTEEGNICKTQTRLPLVGFIDMPNVKEENICETSYTIRNVMIKPNSIEEHSVYIVKERVGNGTMENLKLPLQYHRQVLQLHQMYLLC